MQNKFGASYFLKIGLTLLVITALVAGMLAAVNMITKDKIDENNLSEQNAAIKSVYGEGDIETEEISGDFSENVGKALSVKQNGESAGYCFEVNTSGYGGNIKMMVGINSDGSVRGIGIVEMSETAGLGSRVSDETYLSQYGGKSTTLTVSDIDVITGSTVSSKAIMNGVNAALDAFASTEGSDTATEGADGATESTDASTESTDASTESTDASTEGSDEE